MNLKQLSFFLVLLCLTAAVVLFVPQVTAAPLPFDYTTAVQFVVRVHYNSMTEVQQLADAGYDIWENNLNQQYLVIAVDQALFAQLQKAGWVMVVDSERSAELQPALGRLATFYGGYRTVDTLYSELQTFTDQYPDLAELVDYGDGFCKATGGCVTQGGQTLAGYDLLALRITNEAVPGSSVIEDGMITQGSKPVFFLMANIHAREITTPELALRMAAWLLEGYEIDVDATWLIDWHEIWIIPTANPEGHWLVELGTQPPYTSLPFYQRKNAHKAGCIVWPPLSAYQSGVDLNRNHSFGWGGASTSSDPCSPIYKGVTAASEPEVIALQNLLVALIPDQRAPAINDPAPDDTAGLFITLHSYGDLVLWPWGNNNTAAPNRIGLKAIGDHFAAFNGYLSCQAPQCLYSAAGTTDDWVYATLGIPSYTFEIGDQFMPAYNEVDDIQWPDNAPALRYAARIARTPYRQVFGPDVTMLTATQATQEIVLTAVVDDALSGSQPISETVYAVDMPYWAGGVELAMIAADGVFDGSLETAEAIIDVADYNPGRHIVFVRSQDATGYWGPTYALFIDLLAESRKQTFFFPLLRK